MSKIESFAPPNWSLLTTSLLALATEDPILTKEEGTGATTGFCKLCPILDIMGLAQFYSGIWFLKQRVLGGLIQDQIVLGFTRDTSCPNQNLGGLAEVFIIPIFADPIINYVHDQATLTPVGFGKNCTSLGTTIFWQVQQENSGQWDGKRCFYPSLEAGSSISRQWDPGVEEVETFPSTEMLLVSETPMIFKHEEIMVIRKIERLPNFYLGEQNYEIKSSKAAPEVDHFVALVLAAKTAHVYQNVVLLSEPVIMVNAQDIEMETSVPKRSGVVMLHGIAEDATIDILEASSELVLFLVRAVIDDVLIPLNLKESDSRLSPIGIGSLMSRMVQLLEAGLASYRQWDPEKRHLVFDDYCTRRIFGECCYGALENFSVVVAPSVLMLMSGFSGDLEVLHTPTTQLDREVIATIRTVAALNSGKGMHGLFTSHFEASLLFCFWKGQIFGNGYGMVPLALYISYALGLWYAFWRVKHENSDFFKTIKVLMVLVLCIMGALIESLTQIIASKMNLYSKVSFPYFNGNWKGRLWKKLHGRKSSIIKANFTSSDLRTSLFFKRVAMLEPS